MLHVALTISALHLAWMNWLAHRKAGLLLCWVTSLCPVLLCAFVGFGSVPILLQTVSLPLILSISRLTPKRRAIFPTSSVFAVAVIYCGLLLHTWSIEQDLLRRYPLESMADRVPTPKASGQPAKIANKKTWTSFEDGIQGSVEWDEKRFLSRSRQLRRLHENTTDNFVNSSGFGVTRMTSNAVLRPDGYDRNLEPAKPIEQPETTSPLILSTDVLETPYVPQDTEALSQLHFGGLSDFVNVQGFGFVKDRQHVAGFRPHEFSKMPKGENLRVQRLELVSLLMHEKPVAYVSKDLPRMKELKAASTRGLSDFEKMGLVSVQDGEDLFVRETPNGLLMLGAIRSVSQCLKCHGGERGDLLGAFSYILARSPDQ